MGRHDSEFPVRARRSPQRRSPSRRERSPARYGNLNADKISSRNRSPRRARSRSPVYELSAWEKLSSHGRSPKHKKSQSPVKHKTSFRTRSRSPKHVKSRSPSPIFPPKDKPPSRFGSPKQVKPGYPVSQSSERGKLSSRTMSPRSARSRSSESRSRSPRTKRLKRGKAVQEVEKGSQQEHDQEHSRKADKATYRERDADQEPPVERKDRRSGRDADDNGSSRSRHSRRGSPSDNHHREQHRSRSPSAADNRGRDEAHSRDAEQRNGDNDSIAKMKAAEDTLEAKEKAKPSFELSGKLAAETNRFRGVTLLFNEPPDARKPDIRWRLYVFKGGEVLNEPLYVHRQSCYLFGRERRVADIPTDHPSCSKQHAVLQYRQVEEENPDGAVTKRVRPYVMDLGSTNGTFINDSQIEPQRYYELFEKDTIRFGNSSREYVLLHENSAG